MRIAEGSHRGPALPAAGTIAVKGRILLVEDQPALLRAYARIIEAAGYEVAQAPDGKRATDLLGERSFDLILTDINLPDMSGTELLRVIRARDLDVPVILCTGNPSIETAVDAVEHGALRYLIKPIRADELTSAVDRATTLGRIARVKRESVEYLASLDRRSGQLAEAETQLRAALASLYMAYQPIVDWQTKRVIAYEALVRTREPTVPHPGVLFGLAEQVGEIGEVGRAIRASVARTMAEQPPDADVFVNLHPSDLLDDQLYSADDPLAAFAGRVVLEVTEREAVDATGISNQARKLRQLGYRIAIDDLGAGYSGLTYFAQLTPEVVKIDMSLVRGIHGESIKQKLVGSLVSLCKDLGMRVVAEGIETPEECATVVALGCDYLQGYLFGRPGMPYPRATWH